MILGREFVGALLVCAWCWAIDACVVVLPITFTVTSCYLFYCVYVFICGCLFSKQGLGCRFALPDITMEWSVLACFAFIVSNINQLYLLNTIVLIALSPIALK